jgi:hypothetical protein
MMRKTPLAALALAVAIAPAALASGGGPPATLPPNAHGPQEPGAPAQSLGTSATAPQSALPSESVDAPAHPVGPPDARGPDGERHDGRRARPPVAYVLRGIVSGTDATAQTITLTLKGGNRFATRVLSGTDPFDVLTGTSTRFSKAGLGPAGLGDVSAGDRVLVRIMAPRDTSAGQLKALIASRVVDRGPAPGTAA